MAPALLADAPGAGSEVGADEAGRGAGGYQESEHRKKLVQSFMPSPRFAVPVLAQPPGVESNHPASLTTSRERYPPDGGSCRLIPSSRNLWRYDTAPRMLHAATDRRGGQTACDVDIA